MRAGAYIETAAVVSGVSKQTLYAWCKLGHKKPKSLYAKLLDAVERASEECTTRDLLNIDKCAMGVKNEYERDENGNLVVDGQGNPIVIQHGAKPDWKASAWRLEKRSSKFQRQETNINVKHPTNENGQPVEPVQIVIELPSNGRELKK